MFKAVDSFIDIELTVGDNRKWVVLVLGDWTRADNSPQNQFVTKCYTGPMGGWDDKKDKIKMEYEDVN
jgi:hypothetical protein